MINKMIMMLTILIVGLLTVSAVNASENITDDIVGVENQDNNVISEVDDNILNANPKTFTDLNNAINGNGDSDVYLQGNYTYDSDSDSSFKRGVSIDRAVTIHGNGYTIDGANTARIFRISNTNVVLKDIIFANGQTDEDDDEGGGAIYGNCSAVNCTFKHNSAGLGGGAMDEGSAVNCTFISNSAWIGGAMCQGSAVNCTFIRNSASMGGAIAYGSAVDCTFISNSAREGGAIYDGSAVNCTFIRNSAYYGSGGAMYGDRCTANNCIFVNNSARNGGATYQTTANNCNFTNNSATECGGAMYLGISVNSTFRKNYANLNGGAVYDVLIGNCLFEYNSAKNGGAMNKGKASDCSFNYNNATAYGGAVCNAKVSTSSNFINNYATTGSNTYNVTWFNKDTTKSFADLNRLINNKNKTDIYLNCNYTFDLTTDYDFKEGVVVDRAVTIHGNGYTIDGDNIARIFTVSNSNIVFRDVVFTNGYSSRYSSGGGGAIFGDCSAVNCIFVNNSADWLCGAIYGDCSAVNCTFIGNSARWDGGAMYYCGSAVNCVFVNNSAGRWGGAMYYCGSAVNCVFVNNSAGDDGGAMCDGSAVNCVFVNNSADDDGGAMYDASAIACVFVNNSAGSWGGAMCFCSATDCIFKQNTAIQDGNDTYFTDIHNSMLSVSDFISTYKSGDKLLVNLTLDGEPISDVDVTIRVYKNDVLVGTYYCLIDEGWTVTLDGGNYIAVVSIENQAYKPDPVNVTLIINKADTYISASDVIIDKDESGELIATLTNEYGNVLTGANMIVNINGVNYNLKTNSKGQIKLHPDNLDLGTYNASIYYKGNSKYNPSSTSADITVNVVDSNISAFYDVENKELIVNLTNAASGKALVTANVVVSVNGANYTLKTNSKGQVKLSLSDLDFGIYTASVYYKGNSRHNPVSEDVIVNTKMNSNISAFYDVENKELIVNLTNAASGKGLVTANVVVNIGGVNYTLKTNSKGQVKLSLSDLNPGIYTASVYYKGSNKYNPSSADIVANARLDSNISAFYDIENKELTAILTNAVTGKGLVTANVVVSINGVNYTLKTNSKGQIKLYPDNLDLGTYNASVYYKGNSKFNPSSANIDVAINVVDSNISAFYDVENKELTAVLSNAVSGKGLVTANVVVSINGVNYTLKTNSKGQVKLSLSDLNPGIYNISVYYKGNSKHNPASTNVAVTIKTDTNISTFYDIENKELSAILTNAITGKGIVTANVVVSINGVNYTLKTNSKGQVKLSTSDLNLGTYNASIYYKGNSKFYPSSASADVVIKVVDSSISASYDAENEELTAVLTNAISGKGLVTVNVIVSINGVDYTLRTNSKGQVKLSLSDFAPGSYSASVYYKGNTKYNPSSTTVNVMVIDNAVQLIADNVYINYGENTSLVVTLKDSKGNPIGNVDIAVVFNGETYTLTTDDDGVVQLSVGGLAPDEYVAAFSFAGNDYYNDASATATVSVNKSDVSLVANNTNIYYGESASLVATLLDSSGNPIGNVGVTVVFNGETYSLTTDDDGVVQLSVADLTPDRYTVTYSFAGNDYYKDARTYASVMVNKLLTRLRSSSISATYGKDYYLYAFLSASSSGLEGPYSPIVGATVSLTVNNVAYSLTTDSYGQVKFNTKNLLPGTYRAQMVYDGSSIYDYAVVEDVDSYGYPYIIINKASPTITTTGVTVTYGTEGFVTATLKDPNGNVMANRLVTFTFGDGTGITVRTDSYGKAKLSTSGYNAGTYNLVVTFTPESGSDDYNKYAAVSSTVTMKINKADAILYARYAPNSYGFGEWIVNKQGQKVKSFNINNRQEKDLYIYAEDKNGNPLVGVTIWKGYKNNQYTSSSKRTTDSAGAAIYTLYYNMMNSYDEDITFVLDSPNYNDATVTVHVHVAYPG